jgi:RNA polymerase sigma-70 factor, ECF subfamily
MSPPGTRRADDLQLHLQVLRCQAGDERAFASLMGQFGERTLSYLGSLVGGDADDVQQELWLTVYRTVSTLHDPRAFRTWLFRSARHRAIDWMRRRKRERELLDDVAIASAGAVQEVDETTLSASQLAALDAALAEIPPPQHEVLLLRYRDDMSYAEIASIVGVPLGTVRTRLHHGRKRLQELYERGLHD